MEIESDSLVVPSACTLVLGCDPGVQNVGRFFE